MPLNVSVDAGFVKNITCYLEKTGYSWTWMENKATEIRPHTTPACLCGSRFHVLLAKWEKRGGRARAWREKELLFCSLSRVPRASFTSKSFSKAGSAQYYSKVRFQNWNKRWALAKRTFMRWEWRGRAIFEFELSKTPFPPSAGQVKVNRDGAIKMFTKKLNIWIRNCDN